MASVRSPWKTAASATPRAECHKPKRGARVNEQGVRAKPSSIAEVLETAMDQVRALIDRVVERVP